MKKKFLACLAGTALAFLAFLLMPGSTVLAESTTKTFRPTDATYVSQYGNDYNTNFYGQPVMRVNYTENSTGSINWGQHGYLKFDIGDITRERITSAKLRLYVESTGDIRNSTRTIGIFDTYENDWDGQSITWGNMGLGARTQLGSFTVSANGYQVLDPGWREIDVTEYLKNGIDQQLSFMAKMTSTAGHPVAITSGTYNGSPEDFDETLHGQNMPALVVEYNESGLTPYDRISLYASQDTYVDQNNQTTSFSNSEYLKVNYTANEGRSDYYGNHSYLDFDVSGIVKVFVNSAKLWVYVDANSDVRKSTRTIGVFKTASNWSPSMTWANGRVASSGDEINSFTVSGNNYYITDPGWRCVDVTDYVKTLGYDNDNASFMLKTIYGNAHPVSFRSMEHNNTATRPRLVLNYALPGTGLIWETPNSRFPKTELPISVDLTSKFPSPHPKGQLGQNNGNVWALVYALRSGQENIARNWGVDTDAHLFSPSYVYNQLNDGDKSRGVAPTAVMQLMVEQGVCSLESFPYDADSWKNEVTQPQREEAAQFKPVGYNLIIGLDEIKKRLAGGDGVVIGINVLQQFDTLNSMPLSGPIQVFNDPTGSPRGSGHAICLIGYDDELEAFKFINSWGNKLGYGGYGWIAYDMVEDTRVNRYGEALGFVLNSRHNYIIDATVKIVNNETPQGGKVTGNRVYDHGEIVTLTATPDDGYEFYGWYEDGVIIKINNATLTFPAVANRTLEARFVKESGSAASVYIMATAGSGGTVAGEDIYEFGDTVTLTATPDTGYVFDGWYENDVKVNGAGSTYSFVAQEFRILEARFEQVSGSAAPVYIMATAGSGGTVIGEGIYEFGDTVTLAATPDTGYAFDGWYENDVKINDAGSTYSFVAEEFRMLEARFK